MDVHGHSGVSRLVLAHALFLLKQLHHSSCVVGSLGSISQQDLSQKHYINVCFLEFPMD